MNNFEENDFDTIFVQKISEEKFTFSYFVFFLFSIFSIIFLCTYELAGICAIYQEKQEIMIPKMIRYLYRNGKNADETIKYSFFVIFECVKFLLFTPQRTEDENKETSLPFQFWLGILFAFLFLVFDWNIPLECTTSASQMVFTSVRVAIGLIYITTNSLMICYLSNRKKVIAGREFFVKNRFLFLSIVIYVPILRAIGVVILKMLV